MEPASPQPEVTVLLARARAGDAQALGAAFSAMYEELKRSARSQLRRSRQGFPITDRQFAVASSVDSVRASRACRRGIAASKVSTSIP